jgi:hypothetical protein
MKDEKEEQGFSVSDKRHFREDGEVRSSEPSPEPVKTATESPRADASIEPHPEADQEPGAYPQIDFPSYILSYYTQGLVLLGEVPNPYTNQKEEDVEGAHHTVDILSMLQEKTKGNLTKDEEQLLDSVLYELRMKFMAKTSRIKI